MATHLPSPAPVALAALLAFCHGAAAQTTITVTGHAKGDITELKHSCKACGDDSAFCCATTKSAKPTEGMEKK